MFTCRHDNEPEDCPQCGTGSDAAKLQIALLTLRHYSLGPNPQAAIDALRQVEAIEREQPDISTLCDKLPE